MPFSVVTLGYWTWYSNIPLNRCDVLLSVIFIWILTLALFLVELVPDFLKALVVVSALV